jgi:hypothetical protein
MAIDESLVYSLPQELIGKAEFLITILQAVGGFIIVYIIFNIINTMINRKRNKKIDKVIEDLEAIKKALVKKRN